MVTLIHIYNFIVTQRSLPTQGQVHTLQYSPSKKSYHEIIELIKKETDFLGLIA